MYCHHLSGSGVNKTFMCSKISVAHPNGLPASMGTLMGKRMICDISGCSVTKVGLCIDVRQSVFVPERCDPSHLQHASFNSSTASTACAACGAEYNCDVPNAALSLNDGTANRSIATLSIDNLNLSWKAMRVRFATLATAILAQHPNGINGTLHQCNSAVVEKADNFLRLS